MDEVLINIRNLTKSFGSETALDSVSLDVYEREFLVLLGPSGCGKTTLLRLIGGFENPDSGEIRLDHRDLTVLPPNKRPVNMVFQSYAVFPHLNVRDNIAYGLKMDRVATAERNRRVDEALALVQLESLQRRHSHELSGGQRQRVALARALVKRPRVLLLDEPLSALDAKLREAMQNELVKLHRSVGITFILVTHDQDEALSMAQRVAVMRRGKIVQLDTPRNLYEAPRDRFVADFVGRMNILPARAHPNGAEVEGLGVLPLPSSARLASSGGEKWYVAIRPEKLVIGDAPSSDDARGKVHAIDARIESVSYYGDETVLTVSVAVDVAVGNARLTVTTPNRQRNSVGFREGDSIKLWWHSEDMIVLPE